jgi:hypothetical protein
MGPPGARYAPPASLEHAGKLFEKGYFRYG